jgi:hypothetical protein
MNREDFHDIVEEEMLSEDRGFHDIIERTKGERIRDFSDAKDFVPERNFTDVCDIPDPLDIPLEPLEPLEPPGEGECGPGAAHLSPPRGISDIDGYRYYGTNRP